MSRKPLRFFPAAVFLAVILVTMLLSRFEEVREQTAAPPAAPPASAENVPEAVPVLMYHHLLKRAENTRYQNNDIVTYVEDFAEQIRWLKNAGYHTITPAQLVDWYENGAALPEKPVLFTFDDGYLSNAVYAYPLLKEAGYTAVIFSVTGKIGTAAVSFRPTQINMLDDATMRACEDVFFYASHTHDLHTIQNGKAALTRASTGAVAADIAESLAVIKTFPSGCPVLFSYPYGSCSNTVEDLLRENGVRLAFRAHTGQLTRQTNPYELPRFPMSYKVSLSAFKKFFETYT